MNIREYLRQAAMVNQALRDDSEQARLIRAVPRHYAANIVETTSGDATKRGRSTVIWKKFKFGQYQENNNNGSYLYDDFQAFAGQPNWSIVRLASTLSPSAVSSQTAAVQTVAFAGTVAGDLPIAIQKPTFQAGLALDENLLIGANNSLSLGFVNATAGSITPTAAQSYVLTVLRQNGFYSSAGGGWRSQEGGATLGSVAALSSDSPTGPNSSTAASGTIRLSSGGAAHNSVALEAQGGQFGVGGVSAATIPSAVALPRLFYETRVRFAQSTVQSAFIGLAQQGLLSGMNTLFDNTDAWQNKACIGFRVNGATSTSAINAVYATTTGTSSVTSSAVVPATLTNWTKLGFYVDPFDPVAPLQFFQDGALVASAGFSALTAANWPSAVALTPLFYLQAQGAGGAQVTMDVDWISVGQTMDIN